MGSSNFNLRQSVDNYVNLIQNQGALTGSDAKELTHHLLDATEELKKSGLSDDEAFMIASKRLGNDVILTEEYAKVNPSLSTNKIWSYLFIGYNLFYTIPSIVFMVFGGLYLFMYKQFESGLVSVIVIVTAHLLFSCLVIYLVRKKVAISEFIESQVRMNPLRIVLLSFLPQLCFMICNLIFAVYFKIMTSDALSYPMRKFRGTLIEFTYYLAIFSIVAGLLSLLFSIRKSDNISFRSLFEKPSILFLISFGVLIELLSASTRTIPSSHVFLNSMIFGLIYMGASYLISLYNESSHVPKYLAIFALFGFVIEVSLGFNKAIENGYFYNNIYFGIALLGGVILGWKLGITRKNAKLIQS